MMIDDILIRMAERMSKADEAKKVTQMSDANEVRDKLADAYRDDVTGSGVQKHVVNIYCDECDASLKHHPAVLELEEKLKIAVEALEPVSRLDLNNYVALTNAMLVLLGQIKKTAIATLERIK